MSRPSVQNFLVHSVYPAGLAGLGVAGNRYLLGSQSEKVEVELRSRMDVVKNDLGIVKEDVTGLVDMERRKADAVERMLDCGKKKKK
ncbi:hypothetical protein HO173_002375 [Letharia columbiana]|uniref:Uncharacterized protein n=1 Tax=Letharia columbiana TaxID=112416 RepID=A0A8H6L8W6_9LECA|nr:uncharacterized protein HO173_002375 [Letharia columbiana]KAF6239829.1 hypothetical protein HO173_002375 [Letharia columbiana]